MRRLLFCLCALILTATNAAAARLLVLDFELVDSSGEPVDRSAEHARRLAETRRFVAGEIVARGLFELANDGPVREKIDAVLAHQYLRNCNGCELTLAREAGADFVLLGKFNKVSTLIGSMEMRLERVSSGAVVFGKSYDYRGDDDRAWRRAAKYFVDELARGRGQIEGASAK